MLVIVVATSLVASPVCARTDAKAELLSVHETTRQAHLKGDAGLIAGTIGDQLLFAEDGTIRVQSNAEVARFFTGYFERVRYLQWRDMRPPVVSISPDGQMAWMAVEVEAQYTRADKPEDDAKRFKSSWIATYQRDECSWRMTGMASDVVE